MRVSVFAVGKLKDPGLQALCDDYRKRCQPVFDLEIEYARNMSDLRKRWASERVIVIVDERGLQLSTLELRERFESWRSAACRRVAFALGDAHGFDDSDRAGATMVLALSRLTLPHRLAQIVLIEQIYRVGMLLVGHPYHHT